MYSYILGLLVPVCLCVQLTQALPKGLLALSKGLILPDFDAEVETQHENKVFVDRSVDSFVEVENVRCGFFIKHSGKSLFGYNTERVEDIELSECLRRCTKATRYHCRSVDYNDDSSSNGQHTTCFLSSENGELQPEAVDQNFNTDYYERSCEAPGEAEEGSAGGNIII